MRRYVRFCKRCGGMFVGAEGDAICPECLGMRIICPRCGASVPKIDASQPDSQLCPSCDDRLRDMVRESFRHALREERGLRESGDQAIIAQWEEYWGRKV